MKLLCSIAGLLLVAVNIVAGDVNGHALVTKRLTKKVLSPIVYNLRGIAAPAAGEPLVMKTESGEGAMGVHDVKVDSGLIGGRVGGAIEEGGFERGDAVEAPGGVGEFLGELGFGGGGGLVFVEKLAAVVLVGGGVLGGEDGRAAGEAVGDGVHGRTLFACCGAGAGGAVGCW